MGSDPEAELNVESNLPRFVRWAKQLAALIARHRRIAITIDTDRVVIIRRRYSNSRSEPARPPTANSTEQPRSSVENACEGGASTRLPPTKRNSSEREP
jgi:hypothetical protein